MFLDHHLPSTKIHKLRGRYHLDPVIGKLAVWCAMVIGIPGMIACLLSNPEFYWQGWVFVLVGLALFFYGMPRWVLTLSWDCPGCKRELLATEPWRCELCLTENRKLSFLDRCSNSSCRAEPTAYECQHRDCHALTYLTSKPDGRFPARSLSALKKPQGPTPLEVMRSEKSFQLETTDLDRQLFEAEAKKLAAEIDLVRLQKKRNQPEPVFLSPHQARIKWAAEEFEEADFKCATVPQTVEKELECHAKIDANPNIQDDAVRQQLKRAMSMHFEAMRIALDAPDVQVQKDHR